MEENLRLDVVPMPQEVVGHSGALLIFLWGDELQGLEGFLDLPRKTPKEKHGKETGVTL